MIQIDQIQNEASNIQFALTLVETAKLPLDSTVAVAEQPVTRRPGELTLTGSQVLAGCIAALCPASLLLWAVIKLWLFEP